MKHDKENETLLPGGMNSYIEYVVIEDKKWQEILSKIAAKDAENAKQAAEIERLKAVSDLYYDLLYCVGRKHPGETRHETAKKYLINSEKPQNNVPQKSATPEAE